MLGGFIGIAGEGFADGDAHVDAAELHAPHGPAFAEVIAVCFDEDGPHRSTGLRGDDADAALKGIHHAFLLPRAGALGEEQQPLALPQG